MCVSRSSTCRDRERLLDALRVRVCARAWQFSLDLHGYRHAACPAPPTRGCTITETPSAAASARIASATIVRCARVRACASSPAPLARSTPSSALVRAFASAAASIIEVDDPWRQPQPRTSSSHIHERHPDRQDGSRLSVKQLARARSPPAGRASRRSRSGSLDAPDRLL
jgi:hypothetical protein